MKTICLRSLTVVTLVLVSCGIPNCKGQCPNGWRNFQNSSCYLFMRQTAQWTNARKTCVNLGGDIVKINSTAENNFVTRLMSRSSWIGIFRDMTTGGKDFIWSDWSKIVYSNWGNGEPNNWSGKEACGELSTNGKWNDNNCLKKYPYICKKGVDWCLVNNGGCPQICTNVDSRAVCSCRRGYAAFSNGTLCTDLKSALTVTRSWERNCSAAANISSEMKNSSATCSCQLGYSSVKTGNIWTCRDYSECSNGNGGCQQSCVNTAGSYKCQCKQGFLLNQDGKTCTGLEQILTQNRSWELQCLSSTANVSNCKCAPGYAARDTRERSTCHDINECVSSNGGCQQSCVNSAGSYKCQCNQGFLLNQDGKTCTGLDIVVTENRTWEVPCTTISPGNRCQCVAGFRPTLIATRWTCKDFDECSNGNGGCQQSCVNTAGSYKCQCKQGFLLNQDGKTCTALESVLTNNTSWEVKCNRSCGDGCRCRPGFKAKLHQNVSTCIDVDECMVNNGGCQHACANTVGSYKCSCRAGFVIDQDGKKCKDLTSLMNGVSGLLPCTSGAMSDCNCRAGYQARRLGPILACFDVDECSLGFSNGGCDHVCINTPGNYSCSCRDGYIKLQQGRICKEPPPREPSSTVATTVATTVTRSATSTKSVTERVGTLCPTKDQMSTTASNTTDESRPTPISAKQTGGQEKNLCQDQIFLLKVLIGCIAVLIIIICSAILYFCLMVSRMRRNWNVESSNQENIKGEGITFMRGKYVANPEFVNPVYGETFAT